MEFNKKPDLGAVGQETEEKGDCHMHEESIQLVQKNQEKNIDTALNYVKKAVQVLHQKASLFSGVNPNPTSESQIHQVLENIRQGKWGKQIAKLREIKRESEDRYNEQKINLSGFTSSCKVKYRGLTQKPDNPKAGPHNLLSATGIITADLDDLPDPNGTKERLSSDPNMLFAFLSPGEDGLKVGLYNPEIQSIQDHLRFYRAIESYFQEAYGLKIDTACKDIARLCFMSHDPDLFINEDACPFPIENWENEPPLKILPQPPEEKSDGWENKYAQKVLTSSCEAIRTATPGEMHFTRLRSSRLVGGYVAGGYLDENEAFQALTMAVEVSGTNNLDGSLKTIHDGFENGKQYPIQLDGTSQTVSCTSYTKADFEKEIDETNDHDKILKEIYPAIIQAGLLNSEVELLQKKIKSKTKNSISALRADAKRYERSERGLQLDYARAVIEKLGSENIITTNSGMRVWRGKGYWEQADPLLIRQQCHAVMPEEDITKSKVDSVYDLIRTETYRPDHTWNQDVSTINCLNGELHFNGERWELQPHFRENYRTTQLNVHYDPTANAPKTEAFLKWVVAKDGDEKSDKIKLLLQIVGYCLLVTVELEKFFVLVGKGANGKSVFVNIIRQLLGAENHTAVAPSKLGDQFMRANLHNKLANIVTELKPGEKLADEHIKSIASGETMTAAHKFGHPFSFEPFSTMLFATNYLPKTDDTSEAMKRRVILVEFTNQVRDDEQNPKLSKELMQESSGVINMVLEALADLLKTGKFTIPKCCHDLKHIWIMQANHVAEFVDEVCDRVDDDDFVTVQHLYAHYLQWAASNGIPKTHSKNVFGMYLRALGIESKKDPSGNFRGYKIRLKYVNNTLSPAGVDDLTGLPLSSDKN